MCITLYCTWRRLCIYIYRYDIPSILLNAWPQNSKCITFYFGAFRPVDVYPGITHICVPVQMYMYIICVYIIRRRTASWFIAVLKCVLSFRGRYYIYYILNMIYNRGSLIYKRQFFNGLDKFQDINLKITHKARKQNTH